MPKAKLVNAKEISDLPLYLTIKDIEEYLGFSRNEIDCWFKDKTFPCIKAGIKKVNKYDLLNWINKIYGNSRATYISYSNFENKFFDELQNLNATLNELNNKIEPEVS